MLSTDPRDTVGNLARDMQWGQGVQLLEKRRGEGEGEEVCGLRVREGDEVTLRTRVTEDRVGMQFEAWVSKRRG